MSMDEFRNQRSFWAFNVKRKLLKGKPLVAFQYYGGKNSHLKHILPMIPDHDDYFEPFAGSLAVLLNKKSSKGEVANDIDKNIYNFFVTLRDHSDDFLGRLELTRYSRDEFALAATTLSNASYRDDIERARCFFVVMRMSLNHNLRSLLPSNFRSPIHVAPGRRVALGSEFPNAVEKLAPVVERLKNVAFENKDALKLLEVYQRKEHDTCFIYCDPPYANESLQNKDPYTNAFPVEKQIDLLDLLVNMPQKVMISGYYSDLYMDYLHKWNIKKWDSVATVGQVNKSPRVEYLWMNYDIRESNPFGL